MVGDQRQARSPAAPAALPGPAQRSLVPPLAPNAANVARRRVVDHMAKGGRVAGNEPLTGGSGGHVGLNSRAQATIPPRRCSAEMGKPACSTVSSVQAERTPVLVQ